MKTHTHLAYIACFALLAGLLIAQTALGASNRMGMNFYSLVDWNRDIPLVDLMKMSRPWIAQREGVWDTREKLDLDEHGYVRSLEPGQWATTLMLTDLQGHYPTGHYTFLYEGQGKWQWGGTARLISSQPGRQVVEVQPDGGTHVRLTLTAVNADDPPRNMRFIRPGYEATYADNPYATDFLDRWGGVDTIRFMDWMRINRTTQSQWGNRPVPEDRTFYVEGMPLEWMIDLCNRSGSNAWFAIPHLATDQYIRELATMVRDHLDPSLVAYYEFSNEVWNTMFAQTQWAQEQGTQAQLAQRPWEAGWDFYAQQCHRLFDLLDEVYGDQQARYRRVVATQAANDYLGQRKLRYSDLGARADALAIGPYLTFNVAQRPRGDRPGAQQVQDWSLDELFAYLREHALPQSVSWMEKYKQLADAYDLELIVYEGGQHLTALGEVMDNAKVVNLLTQANRDPRMGELYTDYLGHWTRITGGNLFCHWNATNAYGRHGSWGLLEWRTQDPQTSPKYQAVKAWSGALP